MEKQVRGRSFPQIIHSFVCASSVFRVGLEQVGTGSDSVFEGQLRI
jgi:hypothetical protein